MAYCFNDDKTKADIKKKTVTYTVTQHYAQGEGYGNRFSLGMSQADTFIGIGAIDVSFGNPNVILKVEGFTVYHSEGELYLRVNTAWESGQGATALVTITAEVIYV